MVQLLHIYFVFVGSYYKSLLFLRPLPGEQIYMNIIIM